MPSPTQQLVEFLPAPIAHVDAEERYVFANKAYRDTFVQGQEIAGQTVRSALGGDGYERIRPYLQRALRGESGETEARIPYADNVVRTICVTYRPYPGEEDTAEGALFYVKDLTRERDLERQVSVLQRATESTLPQEALLRTVLGHAPVILYAFDTAGLVTLSEGQALEHLGLGPGEAVGTSVLTDYDTHGPRHHRALLQGERRTWRSEVEDRIYETQGTPLFDEDGAVTGALCLTLDLTDEAKAIRAKRRSDLLFEAFAQNTPAILYALDADGRFTYLQGALLEHLGLDAEALLGQSVYDVFADQVRSIQGTRDTLEGEPQTWRDTLGGVHLEVRSVPLHEDDQAVTGLIGVALDVTERVEAERARRRAQQQLDVIIGQAPLVLYATDTEGTFTLSVGSGLKALGLEPGQVVGQSLFALYADLPEVITSTKSLLAGTSTLESWISTLGERSYESYAVPLYDEDGQIVGTTGLSLDVTDRMQAEAAYRRSEKRFRSVFDSQHQFIGLLKPDGTLLEANQAAYDFAQIAPEDVLGKPFWECYWWTISEASQETLENAIEMAAEGHIVQYEAEILGAEDEDGYAQTAIIDFSLKPVFDDEGQVILIIPEGRDITDRIEAEETLRRYAGELEQSNEELEQFAYLASHDLQEPLRTVTSYVTLLQKRYADQLDEDADSFIGFAVDAAERMRALIHDLLVYSRIGREETSYALVDADAAVKNVLTNMEVTLLESQALVTYEPLPTVQFIPSLLTTLLQNLVSNAVKFRKKGKMSRVKIRAERVGATWRFAVEDNGIGIKPQYHDRIFQVFRRLHSRSKYVGTGIGLAICNKIVTRRGGKMWVESGFGEGSTFFFTIPDAIPLD